MLLKNWTACFAYCRLTLGLERNLSKDIHKLLHRREKIWFLGSIFSPVWARTSGSFRYKKHSIAFSFRVRGPLLTTDFAFPVLDFHCIHVMSCMAHIQNDKGHTIRVSYFRPIPNSWCGMDVQNYDLWRIGFISTYPFMPNYSKYSQNVSRMHFCISQLTA